MLPTVETVCCHILAIGVELEEETEARQSEADFEEEAEVLKELGGIGEVNKRVACAVQARVEDACGRVDKLASDVLTTTWCFLDLSSAG